MGYAVGLDNGRWIGYGVPAICDQTNCGVSIDRGLSYLCGDGDIGCGMFFCEEHLYFFASSYNGPQMCKRCCDEESPFEPTADTPEWIAHMLNDESWEQWRNENPEQVAKLRMNAAVSTMEIDEVTYAVEMKAPNLTKEQSDAQIASYASLLKEQEK